MVTSSGCSPPAIQSVTAPVTTSLMRDKRFVAMLRNQFDQPLLAEFAKLIFRLGDAVAISRRRCRRAACRRCSRRTSCHRTALPPCPKYPTDGPAIAAQQQRRQMSRVGVGQRARDRVVATQEHGRVFFRRRAAEELVVQRGHQERRATVADGISVATAYSAIALLCGAPAPSASEASVAPAPASRRGRTRAPSPSAARPKFLCR